MFSTFIKVILFNHSNCFRHNIQKMLFTRSTVFRFKFSVYFSSAPRIITYNGMIKTTSALNNVFTVVLILSIIATLWPLQERRDAKFSVDIRHRSRVMCSISLPWKPWRKKHSIGLDLMFCLGWNWCFIVRCCLYLMSHFKSILTFIWFFCAMD